MSTFGERVRQAREYAGLSQKALADLVRTKQQAIQYLENPKSHARGSRHTNSIARFCGVDAQWLESGQGRAPGKSLDEPSAEYDQRIKQRTASPVSDAEKLLVVLRTFIDTDAKGRDQLVKAATVISKAHATAAAAAPAKRAKRR